MWRQTDFLERLRDLLHLTNPTPRLRRNSGQTIQRLETRFLTQSELIDQVELLNPNLARQRRQRGMARWLMPFGFLAGLTFTQITTLETFSALGTWAQPMIGGLLGMGSGLMGSYAAAASVPSDNEDGVRILRNRHQEKRWLLLLETPTGVEPPWQLLQSARPIQVVRLSEL